MPHYKLIYFDIRGLAEPIRQIFAFAGVAFEDFRIPYGTLTPELKKEMGLDHVPVLQIDGQQMSQSYAIARHLAKKYNLAGKTEDEEFRCDEVVEAVRDYFQKAMPLFVAMHAQDGPKVEELKKVFVEVDSPTHLKRFNDILEKKENTWLVGDDLTYADLYLVHMVYNFAAALEVDLTKNHSAIAKLSDAVNNHPKLKKWFQTRPDSKF